MADDTLKPRAGATRPSRTDRVKPATTTWSDALTIPSQWPNLYANFITKNAGSVAQIESALRSLTYIIPGKCKLIEQELRRLTDNHPGRFRDTEVASESCSLSPCHLLANGILWV